MRRFAFLIVFCAARAWAQPADADRGSGSAAEPAPPPTATASAPSATTATAPTTAPAPIATPPSSSAPAVPPVVAAPAAKRDDPDRGFRFGSYGRVLAGTDLRGGEPEPFMVGAVGPRVVEDTYLELEFSYGFQRFKAGDAEVVLRPVVTLAVEGDPFHSTGIFDSTPALRNLYLDAKFSDHFSGWVGSRMYRGDDIYLLDYWPLDNENTIGFGVSYHTQIARGEHHDGFEVALHGGENRLDNMYQYQTIDVPNPAQGDETIVDLNRQRLSASLGVSYVYDGGPGNLSAKAKLFTQLQHVSPGTEQLPDMSAYEALPADNGFLIGGELSLFGLQPPTSGFRRHLNLFARYAKGLAAFDLLSAPTSLGPDRKTTRANELTFGISGNWDSRFGNVMLGVLSRRFIDASGETENPNDGWEYVIDARPLARLARDWFAGADISYQARFPQGLNPVTLAAEDPAIFQVAPMIVFSPMGPSSYDRPQIRLVYSAAKLNQGALDDYVPGDVRHDRPWEYYLGVQAEWWFNSANYSH